MSKEIRIEIGKFYRLRNNQRAVIFQIFYGNTELGEYLGAIREMEGWMVFQWFIDGKVQRNGDTALDIVGEWDGCIESDSCFGPFHIGECGGGAFSGMGNLEGAGQ